MRSNWRLTALLGLTAGLIWNPGASAKDICEIYRNYTPLPTWYSQFCSGASGFRSQTGGAFSSFADSFNLNPASIPTAAGPIGIEYIGSFTGKAGKTSKTNFAFIKGFSRIGTALSTNSDDTFYSNSILQASQGTSAESYVDRLVSTEAIAPTFNLGTAVSLFPEKLQTLFRPNLGALIRYNKLSKKWTPGFGGSVSAKFLNAGFSVVNEKASATAPETTYTTLTAGVKYSSLQLEYIYLTNDVSGYPGYSEPTHIGTLSFSRRGFLLVGAIRRLQGLDGIQRVQRHFAIQYQFSRNVAAGYLYNYIPGYQSIGAQILF